MPTLSALAGYQPKQDLKWDGINLWPQLTGAEPPKPRAIYIAGAGFRSRMVRDGDWKLVVAEGKKDTAAQTELFNIAADPNETTNLAAKEPQKVEALRTRLTELARADKDAVAND
jgi:arylsulfatase A-like enzyme